MRIAIIGTREPTQLQKDYVTQFIKELKLSDVVVSGCAYGIDAWALAAAHKRSLETVGCLPWDSYNRDVQLFCSQFIVVDVQKDVDAIDSVKKYHPAYHRLSQGAVKLHARNYLIVHGCNLVIACPSDKLGGGGTGQGIRVAQSLGIEVRIVQ